MKGYLLEAIGSVLAIFGREACVGPDGQHSHGNVHQPPPLDVTATLLESHMAQIAA